MIIKTWQDRLKGGFGHNDATTVSAAMQAEINELRAALAAKLVPMTPEEIEKLALTHEAFGFGRVDARGLTTHGFDPEGLHAFVNAVEAHHNRKLGGA